jgi:hypothetical protein
MRSGSAAVLATLLGACGGSSAEPPPVTPAPIPEPADPSDEGEEPEASEPSADETRALEVVSSLAAVPPTAYYLPEEKAVLLVEVQDTEDQGRLITAVQVLVGGTSTIVGGWSSTDEERKQAGQRELAGKLAGKQLVALTFTEWPPGKRTVELSSPAMNISWQKSGKLIARAAGKTITIGELVGKGATKRSRPAGVFASPDSPLAVIRIRDEKGTSSIGFERP